jgi:hypothetical protein
MEQTNQPNNLFDLKIDETSKDHLRTIASWAIIVVVSAVIGYGISIIRYFTLKNRLTEYQYQYGDMNVSAKSGSGIAEMIISIAIGLLINYFLFQFASLSRRGVNNLNQTDLNRGFSNLKTYFAFIGVLIIIALVFGTIAIIWMSSHSGYNNYNY